MSKVKTSKKINQLTDEEVAGELQQALDALNNAVCQFEPGQHPEEWLLDLDVDGYLAPASRPSLESIRSTEFLERLRVRCAKWVAREKTAKQLATLAKHLRRLENQLGAISKEISKTTADDLRTLIKLHDGNEVPVDALYPDLYVAVRHALGAEIFLPTEPVPDYEANSRTPLVVQLSDSSRLFGLAASALEEAHKGGSKKTTKVIGADPSWYLAHDIYRMGILLGLNASTTEDGWFVQVATYLRNAAYKARKGSARGYVRDYLGQREKYVGSAEELREILSALGKKQVADVKLLDLAFGKQMEVPQFWRPEYEDARQRFIEFRDRSDRGV